MSDLLPRRSGSLALTLTALAAFVIGCGGGGGGGSHGTSGTSGTTSNTSTTGSTGIGGGPDTGTGTLLGNAIYYLVPNGDTYDVRYTTEDATQSGTYATGIPSESPVAAPDPSGTALFFAAAPTAGGPIGIYRNGSVSLNGATRVVTPQYTEVDSLQVSRDGKRLVYVAASSSSSNPHLFLVTVGGSTVQIGTDQVASADFSADGTKIVYETVPGTGDTELFVYDVATKAVTQVTSDSVDEDQPQFSKDGSKLAFSLDDGTGRHVLGILATPGGVITPLAPFSEPGVSVYAPSFSGDGTRIAFVAESLDPSQSGIFTCDATTGQDRKAVVTGISPQRALYWTSSRGRSGGITFHLGRTLGRRGVGL